MAIDESLLLNSKDDFRPSLRFYKWKKPTLSLGYFQKATEVNFSACASNDVETIRRPTGGRAVLHKNELTYSITMPVDYFPVSLIESYKILSLALCKGLRELGIDAAFTKNEHKTIAGTAACFDAPSSYELTIEGKKIIGSAQTRKGNFLLQHGSIPIFNYNDLLVELLELTDSKKIALKRLLKRNAGALLDFTDKYKDLNETNYLTIAQEAQKAFIKGFEKELGIELVESVLTQEEKEIAQKLADEKYALDSWNLERGLRQ